MCYDIDARPPDPPMVRGRARGEDVVLTAEDGNRFAAYEAQPDQPTGTQVVIFPDVRGLHQFYKDLALRFGEVGVRALALDYFGRTVDHPVRDDSFEFMPHVAQMTLPTFLSDVAAALKHLRRDQSEHRPTFTLGFCRGGSLALFVGTQDFELTGIIAFYAGLSRPIAGSEGTPLEQAHKIHYPVLAFFGGADQGIPVSEVQKLDDELDQATVEHDVVIYPGAPHSFFDRKQAEFADASADAWTRALNFINAHSPP